MVAHITQFVSGLWQVHAFCEGNTRTTAVFTIQYLRSIGFQINNELFANHSWYFRNALVRANYRNALKGIDYSPVYLERFFQNLLLGEQWDLRNRNLHIHPTQEWAVQPNLAIPANSPASTPQAPRKYPASWGEVTRNQEALVAAIGEGELSVTEQLAALGLKDRMNFVTLFLNPAIQSGFVQALYPDKPRHPRQKYLLTAKGMMLLRMMKER